MHPPDLPFVPWAAPSWVVPGTVAENCRFLRGRAPEVALCLFETSGCLAYGRDDLPAAGETGGMRFHVHLPLDLDWGDGTGLWRLERGAERACHQARRVFDLARHLRPRCAVLHPPAGPARESARRLETFLRRWREGPDVPLLLENTREAPLRDLFHERPGLFADGSCQVCLDVGHLLRYHHELLESSFLPGVTRMVHWNVLGRGDRHLPLTALPDGCEAALAALCARLPRDCVHVVEIFDWAGVAASLPVLGAILRRAGPE